MTASETLSVSSFSLALGLGAKLSDISANLARVTSPLVTLTQKISSAFRRRHALVKDKHATAITGTRALRENLAMLEDYLSDPQISDTLRTVWIQRVRLILEELARRSREFASPAKLATPLLKGSTPATAQLETYALAESCPVGCETLTAALLIAPGAPALRAPALSQV